ncbi:MAG: hypothetical protein AAGF49_08240 [Pseudomonadota bacterium]
MTKILIIAALGLLALPSAAVAQSAGVPIPGLTEAALVANQAPREAQQLGAPQQPGSLFSSDLVGYTISTAITEEALADAPPFKRADGTTSDRVGAFERSFAPARVDAGKAMHAVSEHADALYRRVSGAAEEATDAVKAATR